MTTGGDHRAAGGWLCVGRALNLAANLYWLEERLSGGSGQGGASASPPMVRASLDWLVKNRRRDGDNHLKRLRCGRGRDRGRSVHAAILGRKSRGEIPVIVARYAKTVARYALSWRDSRQNWRDSGLRVALRDWQWPLRATFLPTATPESGDSQRYSPDHAGACRSIRGTQRVIAVPTVSQTRANLYPP